MSARVILVPGTWGNTPEHDDWWKPDRAFSAVLRQRGFEPLSFAWDTQLDGVLGENDKWLEAGRRLTKQIQRGDCVIAHSHGGQVLAYAAAWGLGPVVTLATPVRDDVPYSNIRSSSPNWTHVYGNYTDYMQLLGSAFDGHFHGWRRQMSFAHQNVKVNTNHEDTHDVETWDKYDLWRYLICGRYVK